MEYMKKDLIDEVGANELRNVLKGPDIPDPAVYSRTY
jgi:hypothetical protein